MKMIILFLIIIGVVAVFVFLANTNKQALTAGSNSQSLPTSQSYSQPQQMAAQTQPQPQNPLFNVNKPAPEFTGITQWLNPEKPLTMQELRGKVVLIDFWTNQCINCIHTLPYVTKWYDTYKDQGFVVVGVHTPELAYERTLESIKQAISMYGIHYPIAQDNDFATWKAYDNEYWPAEYLIDKKGIIRRQFFGEGEYEQTEQAIKMLLNETKM